MDTPSTKVTAAALAGAVVTILTFLVDTFTDIDLTAGVAAAVATVLAGLFGFWVKETSPSPSTIEVVRQKMLVGEIDAMPRREA